MATKYTFEPDYAVAPGETLKETLEAKGMTQTDLAVRTGMTDKTISQIISGVAPITLETADRFEMVLGVPARFWSNLELGYRESLARTEAAERLASEVAWLDEIPVSELIKRSYIQPSSEKAGIVRQALAFFGVSSVAAWRDTWAKPAVQYRGGEAQKRHPGKVAAWLRMGELAAEKVSCEPYDAKKFKEAVLELRKYADKSASEWYPAMRRLCAAAGVAVVFVRQIPGASLSGATKWVSKDKAVIMLSLRFGTDDHLWFTFFHEAAHVLFHSKKLVYINLDDDASQDEYEQAANRAARDILIPEARLSEMYSLRGQIAIKAFAQSIGVAPGIVVGRLQRDNKLSHQFCNGLKVKLQWPGSTTREKS